MTDLDDIGNAALKNELHLLAAAFDAVADGMIVLDQDDNIRTFNKSFVELWGIPDDVISQSKTGSVLKHILSVLEDPDLFLQQVAKSPNDTNSRTLWDIKGGRTLEVDSKPQILNGTIVGRLLSCRDVTVQQQAILELNKKESFLCNPNWATEDYVCVREEICIKFM